MTARRAAHRLRLHIQIGGQVSIAPLTPRLLKQLVLAVLDQPLELTLRFVPRAEALRLNHDFRSAGYAPNVLTFDYPDMQAADVVICPPVVRAEAAAQRKSYADHLAHMIIHGTLHAQGHRHDAPRDAARMESIERKALAAFGMPDPYA